MLFEMLKQGIHLRKKAPNWQKKCQGQPGISIFYHFNEMRLVNSKHALCIVRPQHAFHNSVNAGSSV